MSATPNKFSLKPNRNFLTGLGYAITALVIAAAWLLRDRQLVVANEGAGYALGLIGSLMMVLLLLYPLRKRAKWLSNAGPIHHWFRIHMILGITGPVLVLLHSNFNLGSTNGQIALFCTVIVSTSGIVGRYLYAKIHYGIYGNRATFASVRKDIEESRASNPALHAIMPTINDNLAPFEDALIETDTSILGSAAQAISLTFSLFFLRYKVRTQLRRKIHALCKRSTAIRDNEKRLLSNSLTYLNYRLSILRKFAQLHACEKLFSLWHVVHYPLFMVLVVAAVVHVVAVHMY